MSWGWPGMLKSSSSIDVVFNRWESIIFCLGTTSLLAPETSKFKNFETQLPAAYNNGHVVKY